MPTQNYISGSSARSIAESIERGIEAGRFHEGEPLPTIRSLADQLGVSPTTVNAAFAVLRRRGRIVGRSRGGSIVVGRSALQTGTSATAARLPGRNLAVANPDPALLPAICGALTERLVERRLYSDIVDSPALVAAARRAFVRDALAAEHLGIAAGAMDAIERALIVTLAPGDVVALEDPTYPPYGELARVLGLRVVRVRVDARGLVPSALRAALRAGAKALITIPRAQNPIGTALDPERAREVRRVLAEAPDVLVIEDDFLAAIAAAGLVTLTGDRRRWMHVRSYAKTLGPDLRVASYVGDPLTIARMKSRQHLGAGWVSLVLQETAAVLLTDSKTKALIRTAARTYCERREIFVDALAACGIEVAAGTGFTVWVPVVDEAAAVRDALAAGFIIDGGARYRDGVPPGVRVTTTTMTAPIAAKLAAVLSRPARSGP